MSLAQILSERSGQQCELCSSKEQLNIYSVPPQTSNDTQDNSIYCCAICLQDIEKPETADSNHWRCLNDAMWSEHTPVKVVAYRMLHHLKNEGWPQDLLDMIYLEEEDLKWAQATLLAEGEEAIVHKDVNGVTLQNGDNVVLIKDLDVKGGGFTAKRGTAVRNIHLDPENANYIEGKVNGQGVVIITEYVKKN